MKTPLLAAAFTAFIFAALLAQPGRGQLYYDTNGAAAGTAASSTQNFTDAVWTVDPLGLSPTVGYIPDSDVIFSANDLGTNVGSGTQNVTVTDTESVDGFTFDNGTVTLFGSGAPSLSIGLGGITNNSTDGPTTFDSSLGSVTASTDQAWNNDSTQTLNFNSGLTSSGSTITFDGTGTGGVTINGALSGSVNLDQESTTSVLALTNNNNNFSGTITADGGSVLLTNSLPNSNPITLQNNGMIEMDNTQGFAGWNNNITLGAGGGRIYAGNAATGGIDILYAGVVTGGTGLTMEGGDLLTSSNAASDVGTLNVAAGRLLAIGDGIFGNNAVVNVSSGAILDFGLNETLNNQINLASGSFLENRGPSITLTDVILPTGNATVTFGADDVGGGSMTINGPGINLPSGTTLTIVGNASEHYSEYTPTDMDPTDPAINNSIFINSGVSQTAVHIAEQITGSGNLVITPEETPIINATTGDTVGYRLGFGSPIYLDGANNYSGTTTVDGAIVYVGASGFGTSSVTLNSGSTPYYDNESQLEFSGGTFANTVTVETGVSVMNLVGGSSNETISGPIDIVDAGVTLIVANSSAAGLTVGNIHFEAEAGANHYANIDALSTGTITLAGTYASDYVDPQAGNASSVLNFGEGGENGTYVLASTADFTGMQNQNVNGFGALELWAGTLDIETSSFNGQTIDVQYNGGVNHTVNLMGALTLNTPFYVNIGGGGDWTLSQATADESIVEGRISNYASTLDLDAVAGGRLDITGDLGGYSTDTGITKTGAGTVVFNNASGNDFTNGGSANVDIQAGTLLVNNSQGGGLGGSGGTVIIEASATLGGSGNITQQVVAMGPTSVLTAGDPGQANLGIKPTIGLLTLGSLSAKSGLTLAFKFDDDFSPVAGSDYDSLTVGSMDLGGLVTLDFSTLNGFLQTDTDYFIASGSTFIAEPDLTFAFNLPAGYMLATDHLFTDGTVGGFDYDTEDGAMIVVFELAPEPSTYALFALGLLGLVAIRRFRQRSA